MTYTFSLPRLIVAMLRVTLRAYGEFLLRVAIVLTVIGGVIASVFELHIALMLGAAVLITLIGAVCYATTSVLATHPKEVHINFLEGTIDCRCWGGQCLSVISEIAPQCTMTDVLTIAYMNLGERHQLIFFKQALK